MTAGWCLLALALVVAFDANAASAAAGVALPIVLAQVAPSATEVAAYRGLHAAAAAGDVAETLRLAAAGDLDARDGHGRTPLMVAAHQGAHDVARTLIAAGADLDALDHDRYDVLTISAVKDDETMVRIAIAAGADTGLVTSRYHGTALIAAAHLGHDGVVRALLEGAAPPDHVNKLGWTALIEAIVLGDGGPRHVATVQALADGGADLDLADHSGARPLALARQRGYAEIAQILEQAGATP